MRILIRNMFYLFMTLIIIAFNTYITLDILSYNFNAIIPIYKVLLPIVSYPISFIILVVLFIKTRMKKEDDEEIRDSSKSLAKFVSDITH